MSEIHKKLRNSIKYQFKVSHIRPELTCFFLCSVWVGNRYGGLTVGNIQKSIPASFGRNIPPMVRKIAVRRSAQVGQAPWRPLLHLYSVAYSASLCPGLVQQQRLPQHANLSECTEQRHPARQLTCIQRQPCCLWYGGYQVVSLHHLLLFLKKNILVFLCVFFYLRNHTDQPSNE